MIEGDGMGEKIMEIESNNQVGTRCVKLKKITILKNYL